MVYTGGILPLRLTGDGSSMEKRQILNYFVRYVFKAVALIYFFFLFYLTVFSRKSNHNFNYRAKINFQFLTVINQPGTTYRLVDLLDNILMFLPFAGCACFLISHRLSNFKVALLMIVASLIIECSQYIFNLGVFDVDDVFFNFIGGIAGMYLFNFLYENRKIQND